MRIFNLHLAVVVCCFIQSWALSAQCPSGDYRVRFELTPDEFFDEISWTLATLDGSVIYANEVCTSPASKVFNYCVPNKGKCVMFSIRDVAGDGLVPSGFYKLYVNDSLLREGGDYRSRENTVFGCPPGDFCSSPLPLDTGSFVTPRAADTWYKYIPPVTGTYEVSTCEGNACPTKIWVYDNCTNVAINSNQLGTIFYAEGGCGNGAKATLYLAGGKQYFIRIGYAPSLCTAPIKAHLTYQGAIKGCLDPKSCNYNPLATIPDTCYYPGNPNCSYAPDFEVDVEMLRESVALDTIHNPDQCAVDEGCVRGVGVRNVLRFSTGIANVGNQDFFIGTPPLNPTDTSSQFLWDPCHQHWHYRGYAEYIVMNADKTIPIGSKNGFCVLDLECGTQGGAAGKYTCERMGITAGCKDVYDFELPCQWVDITGLEAGFYALIVRVNWTRKSDTLGRIERRYDNNVGQVCFRLSYSGTTPNVEFIKECDNYRDCLGVPLGNAMPDCEGVCNGTARHGDWNRDSLRNVDDINAYLDAVFNGGATTSPCNDLYQDNLLNLWDVGVLQECALHQDDPTYWGLRLPCNFPIIPDNNDGTLTLYPGKLDTVAKIFEVRALNNIQKVMGLDFSVSGLEIDSVVCLKPEFKGQIRFTPQGRILLWSDEEKPLERHVAATPILRVYYKRITGPKVCVTDLRQAVNGRYRKMRFVNTTAFCINTTFVDAGEVLVPEGPVVYVQPNPFQDRTVFTFENPTGEPLTLEVFDLTGRQVRKVTGLRGSTYMFERENLVPGAYLYRVHGNTQGSATGRLLVD